MKRKLNKLLPRIPAANDRLKQGDSWRDNRQSSAERGYGHDWRIARADYLNDNPLCVMCKEKNLIVLARVVDHIIPHRGDMVLFWDRSNWQSLCVTCHNKHKQAMERRNY